MYIFKLQINENNIFLQNINFIVPWGYVNVRARIVRMRVWSKDFNTRSRNSQLYFTARKIQPLAMVFVDQIPRLCDRSLDLIFRDQSVLLSIFRRL